MKYNDDNIFAKIIKKEIPCEKIYEDEDVLSFKDINPLAPVHVLVIPKKNYVSFDDFMNNAEKDYIISFFEKLKLVINKLNISKSGYRIISNHGMDANQEVQHFHFHILAGDNLGGIR